MAGTNENITLNEAFEELIKAQKQYPNYRPGKGGYSFEQGDMTHAHGMGSGAFGHSTEAEGRFSHSGGSLGVSLTRHAFADGCRNIAGGRGYRILDQFDIGDGTGKYFLSTLDGLEVGQNYIVRLSSISRTLTGTIISIDIETNAIIVNEYDPKLVIEPDDPNSPFNPEELGRLDVPPSDCNYLCIIGQPELGDVDIGFNAVTFGEDNIASERSAVAFGRENQSLGQYAFTEGFRNVANYGAHAEGHKNKASGITSHAEGREGEASGYAAHSEGARTHASGECSHTEGCDTKATNAYAHAEGNKALAIGAASHVEGQYNIAYGAHSHAEGDNASAPYFNEEENKYIINGGRTVTIDALGTTYKATLCADGDYSHREGRGTTARGNGSHAEGVNTIAYGGQTHAEGSGVIAKGDHSHAEGDIEAADKTYKFVYNSVEYIMDGAYGAYSHREGRNTRTQNVASHAEGQGSFAMGAISHAEGLTTLAAGNQSHAEGQETQAIGQHSHAGGLGTIAKKQAQTAIGQYNADDDTAKLIVGVGSSNSRQNCFSTGNDGTEDYIKIGETKITETQLKKILAFIDRVENV